MAKTLKDKNSKIFLKRFKLQGKKRKKKSFVVTEHVAVPVVVVVDGILCITFLSIRALEMEIFKK